MDEVSISREEMLDRVSGMCESCVDIQIIEPDKDQIRVVGEYTIQVMGRYANNPAKNQNGGDYDMWTMIHITPDRITTQDDWSCSLQECTDYYFAYYGDTTEIKKVIEVEMDNLANTYGFCEACGEAVSNRDVKNDLAKVAKRDDRLVLCGVCKDLLEAFLS